MGGAGLGLALVSEIARQHNGQVKVTQSSEKRQHHCPDAACNTPLNQLTTDFFSYLFFSRI